MLKKISTLLLTVLVTAGISACTYFFPNNEYENTVWKSRNLEGNKDAKDAVNLKVNIYSRNRIKVSFSNIKKEYLYYIEDNRIMVTNIQDYSQSVFKLEKGKLIVDPKYLGIKVDDSIKKISLDRISFTNSSTGEKPKKGNKTAE
jgi:hypothetical protein